MEIVSKKFSKSSVVISLIFFLISIYLFQLWLQPQADLPFNDEYQSLLSALGFPTYTPNLHIGMLTFFTNFFPDFLSLAKFNFLASNTLLAASFFAFHWKKGITYATNLFFTTILTLSTINIALTRKMHFWAAAFFFIIFFIDDYLDEKQKKIFLVASLLLLGFFRVEFLFSAAVAIAMLAGEHLKKIKIMPVIFAFCCVLAALGIVTFGYGMKDLLVESFKINNQNAGALYFVSTWIKLFFNNISLHFYYSAISFFTTLRIYFPSFALVFFLLLYFNFLKRPWNNLNELKKILQTTYLPFYFPALAALFSVRFMDFYIIMTFVFFLSCGAFLLNTKRSPFITVLIFVLVLPAFFIHRPDLRGSAYINFPTFRRDERIHRQMFDIIANLPVKKDDAPYKILFNQYAAGVLPYEGREYFTNSDLKNICREGHVAFDIVLLTGKWFSDPNQKDIESCVRPGLEKLRHLKFAPGYDLYVSSRVSL